MEIVSAGGTNTHDMTGAHPRVTELQAGSYALMDAAYAPLSPRFRPALTMLGHGDEPARDHCGAGLRHKSGCDRLGSAAAHGFHASRFVRCTRNIRCWMSPPITLCVSETGWS